jgi:hypothetical protein
VPTHRVRSLVVAGVDATASQRIAEALESEGFPA